MADVIEPASSGRAKCRACGRAIGKGELRFGERGPNPFGEGEATWWFHLRCAACKRPEPTLAALDAAAGDTPEPPERPEPEERPEREELRAVARRGVEHPRLARFAGVERSPSNRARCRHCRETIDKDRFRVLLDWWEDGRFGGAGYLHATCAPAYFGTTEDLEARIRWFSPELPDDEIARAAVEVTVVR